MRYFDSREMAITTGHMMASSALPPAFPAVRIEGELYRDGGILSNTPTEVVFEDNPRAPSLRRPHLEPARPRARNHVGGDDRQKDVQYRAASPPTSRGSGRCTGCAMSCRSLVKFIPDETRNQPVIKDLTEYGCLTRMHVVRLLAPRLDSENHTKDIDSAPRAFVCGGKQVILTQCAQYKGRPGRMNAIRLKA